MKKVLKIFGAIFLCLGVIALVVCLCVIPNETKEFFNVVFDYLDRPIVLCGVSITLGGVLLYFITRYALSNTSVGKKKLNDLNDKLVAYSKVAKEEKENINKRIDVAFHSMAEGFEVMQEKYDLLENALKQFPNKKVQEVLNNGKEENTND